MSETKKIVKQTNVVAKPGKFYFLNGKGELMCQDRKTKATEAAKPNTTFERKPGKLYYVKGSAGETLSIGETPARGGGGTKKKAKTVVEDALDGEDEEGEDGEGTDEGEGDTESADSDSDCYSDNGS